jgi:hypothetical protein
MKETDKKDKNSPVESGGSCCCLGIAHKCSSSSSSSSPSQPSLMTQKKYCIRSVVPIWTLESSLLVEHSSDAMLCCLTSCLRLIRLLLHLRLLLSALTMHARTIFLSVPIELSNPCSEHSSCCRSKLGSLQGLKASRESSNQHTFCILFEGLATAFKHKE